MSKRNRRKREQSLPTPFEQARDEVFQHIMQCGVIGALPEHQQEWFDETMNFISGRYHELSAQELKQLRTLAERFVQPPKALSPDDEPARPNEEQAATEDREAAEEQGAPEEELATSAA